MLGNFSRKSMVRGHLNNQIEDELAEGGEDEQILRQRFCFLYCLEENRFGKNRAEVTKIFSESVTSAVISSVQVQWCLDVWPSH